MFNMEHRTTTLPNGTLRHNYICGKHNMRVLDSVTGVHVDISSRGTLVDITAVPALDPGTEPDYTLSASTSGCTQDLDDLMADAMEAKVAISMFMSVLSETYNQSVAYSAR